MRVAVVDCREDRRKAIFKFLKGLRLPSGPVEAFAFEHTAEHLQNSEACVCTCVLLHVGAMDQPDAWYALEDGYKQLWVLCYSGGTEIDEYARRHEAENALHLWYGTIGVRDELPHPVRDDIYRFLNSLAASAEDIKAVTRALRGRDWLLEAKLDLLHSASRGLRADALSSLPAWDALSDFDSRRGRRFEQLVDAADLTALRDYLLPEHDFEEDEQG
ncbi:MAG TPA: hypothetical protein VMF91_04105 [Bryobacteraceae bacterium]|nr:hypothetical protein [Bryobacteraceae bacterium]